MRFTYDPRYNIAYIRFGKKRSELKGVISSYVTMMEDVLWFQFTKTKLLVKDF